MNRSTKLFLIIAVLILGGAVWASIPQLQSQYDAGVFSNSPVWVYKAPERIISTPIATESTVFVRTTRAIYALSNANGQLQWRTESTGSNLDTHPPELFGDILVVPEKDNGSIAVLSPLTGQVLWRALASYDAPVQSITYASNTLVVARYDEYVTAYNSLDGLVRWRQSIPGRGYNEVIADGNVLYSQVGGAISAYDIRSGNRLWSQGNYVIGRMALGKKALYVVLGNGADTTIGAFDLDTHNFLWQLGFPASGATVFTYLTLKEETLFVTGRSIAAVSATDGKVLWQEKPVDNLLVKWNTIVLRLESWTDLSLQ